MNSIYLQPTACIFTDSVTVKATQEALANVPVRRTDE